MITFTGLLILLLGIVIIEQLVVIIMLIVMNCKIKKEKAAPAPTPVQSNYTAVAANPVPQTGMYTKGIMICRKCYRPVQLPNKFCSCCGQSLIMR